MHLCPVDLRKLQQSVGFDVVERYRQLRDFCRQAALSEAADWLAGRLEDVAGKQASP